MKHYFLNKDEEYCFTKEHYVRRMNEVGLTYIAVYEAKKVRDKELIFCKAVGEPAEKNCGRQCEFYSPRNGKSGICKHDGMLFECTDNRLIISNTGKIVKRRIKP